MQNDVNFPAVIKALKKIKYTGPVTAEMLPPDLNVARKTAQDMATLFG